jgi:DNA-binding SARP family transcriptional activator
MHARVARTVEAADPLVACHHYIEANEQAEAMRCLGGSVLLTMGSGRTGYAAELIKRLKGVPADPAVVALQARQLMEEGDLSAAADLLSGVDLTGAPPEARAVFRHTSMWLGWRSGNRVRLLAALQEIKEDPETPPILADISRIYSDSNALSRSPATFPALARRLTRMSENQSSAGHHYYAAIALHDAAVAQITAGFFRDAFVTAERAVDVFNGLSFHAPERWSTTSMMAICCLEEGEQGKAMEYVELSLSTGEEFADVPAVLALELAISGERERSIELLRHADALARGGRSDPPAGILSACAQSFLELPSRPRSALDLLPRPSDMPLDFGFSLHSQTLAALASLLDEKLDDASRHAEEGLAAARRQSAGRFETRLALLAALASQDPLATRRALSDSAAGGQLGLLEVADAIGRALHLVTPLPPVVTESISHWPNRWLPVLRSQLEKGNSPNARAAALLLDEYGTAQDIGRLRAFDKTYLKRGRGMGVGRALARRVGTPLVIHDLGRVRLQVGEHEVPLGRIRRKAASLLMYLVTRPKFTANREQVLDELWPDSRPTSAANSLNQSLYFLRRDIDPWYEDDVSVDYISFEGDLLWLDSALVRSTSAEFLEDARTLLVEPIDAHRALALVERYGGQFCPEFEYEEWAISWRTRVHASFLNLAHTGMHRLVEQGDLDAARDVALKALSVDPQAEEIERGLVWIYWHQGASSAATTLHEHLAARDRADGLDPPTLADVIGGDRPH